MWGKNFVNVRSPSYMKKKKRKKKEADLKIRTNNTKNDVASTVGLVLPQDLQNLANFEDTKQTGQRRWK